MLGEIGFEGELLEAAEAGEGLHLRVGLDVGSQVALVCKRLAALVALERLLTSVGPDVALEQPRPGEGFVAHGALVAKVVGQHVHRQRWHGHVHLAADVTLLGRVGVQTPVGLLVAAQVGAGGVVLATL